MSDEPLPPARGELIGPDRRVVFRYDGRRLKGREGDTVASALFAAGRQVFSRSFNYHRRRGLPWCFEHCPNCADDSWTP